MQVAFGVITNSFSPIPVCSIPPLKTVADGQFGQTNFALFRHFLLFFREKMEGFISRFDITSGVNKHGRTRGLVGDPDGKFWDVDGVETVDGVGVEGRVDPLPFTSTIRFQFQVQSVVA